MKESDIVVIGKFTNETEALLRKSLLESAGVQCSLVHQTISTILPLQTGDFYIELVVLREDEKHARDILSASFDKVEFDRETK